jgi:hypothetical protein
MRAHISKHTGPKHTGPKHTGQFNKSNRGMNAAVARLTRADHDLRAFLSLQPGEALRSPIKRMTSRRTTSITGPNRRVTA